MYKSRCRTCDHPYHFKNCLIPYYVYGDESEPEYKCDCKEYAPKDNLEYLEWMYDQRRNRVSDFIRNLI